MPIDDYDNDDNATGESRYRNYSYKSSSSPTKNSILKNSTKKASQFSDDDDDNFNSGRLSNRNRYDSPINSNRSDVMSAKPPTGRNLGSKGDASREYGSSPYKKGASSYENSYEAASKPRTLPSITYTPPKNNNDNDSDDSMTDRYNKFTKKDRTEPSYDSKYSKDNFQSKQENRYQSKEPKYDNFDISKDDMYDKYLSNSSKIDSKYDKFDNKLDSKYDKYDSKLDTKSDSLYDKYDKDLPKIDNKKLIPLSRINDSKYDTYDEDDKKDLSNKYFRSEGPLTSTKKYDMLDEIGTKPLSARNHRSSSLDRLNSSALTNTLGSTGYSTGSKFQKYNSTNNINDNGSERSYTVNSLNSTTMSVKDAKNRSYLVGSLSALNGKGLLSSEELDRHFIDRKARVLVASWNMGGVKKPPNNLEELVLPDVIQTVPDILIVGVQEFEINHKEWEISLQEQIGPTHVKLSSYYHGSVGINVFVKRELIWFCSVVEFEHINFRAVQAPGKTKGSVVVSFQVFGTLMAFICSHFTAGEGNLDHRVENYNTTINNIKLPKKLQTKSTRLPTQDGTDNFDIVFWFGDMNFLVTKERDKIEKKVTQLRSKRGTNYEDIINHDELNIVMTQDRAFKNFLEGRITFEPTYKYDVNTDNYDTSHKVRIPSYCDRILFRSRHKGSISCYHYDAIKELKLSDHRPVFGLYEVSIRPGVDKVPLSYGEFDRQIYAAGYQRRQMFRAHNVGFGAEKKSTCSIQ